jgi:hypothetical protein
MNGAGQANNGFVHAHVGRGTWHPGLTYTGSPGGRPRSRNAKAATIPFSACLAPRVNAKPRQGNMNRVAVRIVKVDNAMDDCENAAKSLSYFGGRIPVSHGNRMKLPFFRKKAKHLEYTSTFGWFHGESVPKGFIQEYGSGRRPDYEIYVNQFCELRQNLFDKHLKTLPKEIQEQLKNGEHPSQSHAQFNQAEPVLQRLKDILSGMDFIKDVSIKTGQMDLVQFNVTLINEPTIEQYEMMPEFFEGYVINIVWPSLP